MRIDAIRSSIQSLDVIYDNIPEEDLNLMKIYYKRRLIKNIVDNSKE